jgi:N6-adenosine-specific RNA methylase IME4
MSALDFRYINNFAWVKAKQAFSSVPDRWQLERPGLGQYSMGQHELLLFGVMGKSMKPDSKDRPRTAIMAPRPTGANGKMIHSAKPPEARKVIEAVSPGPRMSMFARDVPEGWDGWGNEIEGSLL